jgi:hypothetical protein
MSSAPPAATPWPAPATLDLTEHFESLGQIAALRTLLEIGPWSGDPVNAGNPAGEVRNLTSGPDHEGMVTYLVLENRRRADVLSVLWMG